MYRGVLVYGDNGILAQTLSFKLFLWINLLKKTSIFFFFQKKESTFAPFKYFFAIHQHSITCTTVNGIRNTYKALVAKLVDAPDLGSGSLRCVGSSPIRRTKENPKCLIYKHLGFLF